MGEHMICHCCGLRFDPKTTRWRADHIRRRAEGGSEAAENLWPILESCDAGPDGKAAQDTSDIARGKRRSKKLYGVTTKPGWWKPPGYKHRWGRSR